MDLIVGTVWGASVAATPFEAVAAALTAAAAMFEERRAWSRVRQAIIDANPQLQERELKKMATLARAIAAALRARGVEDLAAALTAESGIAIFRVAFGRWVADLDERGLPEIVSGSIEELKAIVGAAGGERAAVR